jgi:hypothetical protein
VLDKLIHDYRTLGDKVGVSPDLTNMAVHVRINGHPANALFDM